MILEIESVSSTTCRINGWLLDINLLKHWFESKSWPAHTPKANIRELEILIRNLSEGKSITNHYAWLHLLMHVNNYGSRIPDVVFSRPHQPGSTLRFRRDSYGHILVEASWARKYGGHIIEMKGGAT